MNGVAKKTTVLKIGGSSLLRDSDLAAFGLLVESYRKQDMRLIVVHGGGPEIGALHERLDITFDKQLGLRVTSDESMDLVTMVLCGLVNKRIVASLLARGLPSLGLSGVDLGLLRSDFIELETLGRVGGPPQVSNDILESLLSLGSVLVVAPVCLGPDQKPVNVNADTVAHAIATSMAAQALELVSDVPGVRTAQTACADRLSAVEVQQLLTGSEVSGGMIPKLQAALAALDAGIGHVRIGNIQSMNDRSATKIVATAKD